MTDTTHLGSFQGNQATKDTLDGLLAFAASGPDLDLARSLFATKWWDYRFVHPGHALFYMADVYAKKCAEWAPRFGVSARRPIGPYHPLWKLRKGKKGVERHLRPKAQRTALWRLMCVADAHGIPYPKYVAAGMQNCMERGWDRLPTPMELYSTTVVAAVVKSFEEERASMLHIPADPRFHAEGYQGHEWQDQFQKWIVDLIASRPAPHRALFQYMVKDRIVVPKFANATLPPATIMETRRLASNYLA